MPAIDFNAEEHEPRSGFDPLPPGKYVAVVADSEEKPTKAGTGSYIQFTFEVTAGDHKGRKLWARLNLNNPNPTAVEIARGELSALCRAAGVTKLTDTAQLHDREVVLKVRVKKDKESGEERNEIGGYEPAGKPVAAPPAQAPWKRGR